MLAQMFTELVEADPAFRRDVLSGLSAPSRAIPARWFYDRAGSELFESITVLPEYYVTRTEQRCYPTLLPKSLSWLAANEPS